MLEPAARWPGSSIVMVAWPRVVWRRRADRRTATFVASSILPCLAVVALLAVADNSGSERRGVPDDRAVSAGCWNVVAVEWDGTDLDPEWLARLQVVYQADGSWVVFLRRFPVAEGTSTTREDATPKTFEMETLGSEGIEPRRFLGIYRIDGETRVLCIVREGTPRPDEFSAPRNSGRMLVTLNRVTKRAGAERRGGHLCDD